MFPPSYRQEVTTRDGQKIWMVPSEFPQMMALIVLALGALSGTALTLTGIVSTGM